MAAGAEKAAGAFRTIGEVSDDTGVRQHVLRYWETRFPQLKPLQRAGGRRYYRPDDVALVRRIDSLLNQEGYTIRGVQKLLAAERRGAAPLPQPAPLVASTVPITEGGIRAVRDALAAALAES
jgi:DNA-binding transcriptional MerR regulator